MFKKLWRTCNNADRVASPGMIHGIAMGWADIQNEDLREGRHAMIFLQLSTGNWEIPVSVPHHCAWPKKVAHSLDSVLPLHKAPHPPFHSTHGPLDKQSNTHQPLLRLEETPRDRAQLDIPGSHTGTVTRWISRKHWQGRSDTRGLSQWITELYLSSWS